ncbi:EAL domain-containing protein [Lignipirellula cremea]|uniref:Cyclic-di-GMP phosphodiesterase AdrB n=1 Tax=Lignipirellula cremea TaxID=2528010 RepID=A0A518DRI5_9BACT|nr:EAL domain-containing protein [Lignipirellula cremea]QDU94442.1 Putative cyclic-di-GMP phosphodiesterase AdrB [Lignipirellula cremea]
MVGTMFAPLTAWTLSGRLREGESTRTEAVHAFPFRIGRRSELSLCLPCPSISNIHAEIIEKNGVLWVRDLRSTNGTFVNGVKIECEAPLAEGDILQFANLVFRLEKHSANNTIGTVCEEFCEQALAVLQFDKLMREKAVVPYFQPIVDPQTMETIGYEILGRSRLFGLQSPARMFNAASQLNLEAELSRMFRSEGIQASSVFSRPTHLFLNTHPIELSEPVQLLRSMREIRDLNQNIQITLEIHESAVTNPIMMREMRNALNEMNVGLAYDDFGAGQARLIELIEVPPDFLKFDMQLVQGISGASRERQRMIATFVEMVRDLGIVALAEGIEDADDQKICTEIGFELSQGYLFGKPAPAARYC